MFRPQKPKEKVRAYDPRKEYTLSELGLYLDGDHVKVIGTEKPYEYRLKKDEKMSAAEIEDYNDCLWFALTKQLSGIVEGRLEVLGLKKVMVPMDAKDEPYTTIFKSEPKKDLLVVFPDGKLS